MTQKNIIQRAQGYGAQPVTVTVKIDGDIVYQGSIPTLNQPAPSAPLPWVPDRGEIAWSWSVPAEFGGIKGMSIDVDNGVLFLYDTYYAMSDTPEVVQPLSYFREDNDVLTSDPLSNVRLNGVLQAVPRDIGGAGQWVWKLLAENNLTCSVHVEPPPPGPETLLYPDPLPY